MPKTDRCTQACQNGAWQRKIWKQDARRVNLCAEERARDSLEPLAAEAREKWRTRLPRKTGIPGKIARRGRRRKRWQSRDRAIRTFAPSLALGQVAEEEEARRCHRHGRRTGTNAIGWLAGLAARLPLPWRAVQGQTHPLSLQAAVAAAVSEESALLAAIAFASCCC